MLVLGVCIYLSSYYDIHSFIYLYVYSTTYITIVFQIPSSGPRTPPESSTEEEEEEEEEEDEIGESDIFGSSSSSDYEEERRRKQKVSARKRGRSRRWSSSNISEVMDTKFDETQNDSTLITPSLSPLAQPVEEKEVKKEAIYSKRIPKAEETILGEFLKEGPDKEDVLMMRLALSRLKREGADLVTDVPWAYYPPDILYMYIFT